MPQRFLSIKNFEKYQHYHNRLPPWIKLHVELLDDPDFLRLPDASKWQYVGLLLLASRHENSIPMDQNYIMNRLGMTNKLDVTSRFLKEHVLALGASRLLAQRDKIGDSETEKRRDRVETETETDGFDEFWNAYPRKIGKKEARKAWEKAQDKPKLVDLLQAIEKAKHSEQWTKENGQFIPHPSTWLNQGRWDDVPKAKPMTTMEAFLARGAQHGTDRVSQRMALADHATVGQTVPDPSAKSAGH